MALICRGERRAGQGRSLQQHVHQLVRGLFPFIELAPGGEGREMMSELAWGEKPTPAILRQWLHVLTEIPASLVTTGRRYLRIAQGPVSEGSQERRGSRAGRI